MHKQVEEAGPVQELEVVVTRIEQVFGEGDDVSPGVFVDVELVQLTGNDTVQRIVAHLIAFQIDVEAAVPVPYPYNLNMLMPVWHLMLFGSLFTQPLQSLYLELDLLIFKAGS